MTNVSLPIESQVSMILARVGDDATNDLRGMVENVDRNMALKEEVRAAQRILFQYKNAVRKGDDREARRLRNKLKNHIGKSRWRDTRGGKIWNGGLDLKTSNSEEGKAVLELPPHPNGMPDGATTLKAMKPEERDKLLSGPIKQVESMLDARAQSFSDLGQKLQFQLQQANNIYTRANKAMSDVLQKYDRTLNGIAQNLKG